MTLLSKKEFASKCGITTKALAIYARPDRGKVVYSGEMVDDSIEPNKSFLAYKAQKGSSGLTEVSSGTLSKTNDMDVTIEPKTLFDVKTLHQITELQRKISLYDARIQKLTEEVIPRENAAFLIKNYSAGITDVWTTATERFLVQKAVSLNLSREEIIEHKKYINEIVNEAVKEGADRANRNILKMARALAGKKERGESK